MIEIQKIFGMKGMDEIVIYDSTGKEVPENSNIFFVDLEPYYAVVSDSHNSKIIRVLKEEAERLFGFICSIKKTDMIQRYYSEVKIIISEFYKKQNKVDIEKIFSQKEKKTTDVQKELNSLSPDLSLFLTLTNLKNNKKRNIELNLRNTPRTQLLVARLLQDGRKCSSIDLLSISFSCDTQCREDIYDKDTGRAHFTNNTYSLLSSVLSRCLRVVDSEICLKFNYGIDSCCAEKISIEPDDLYNISSCLSNII